MTRIAGNASASEPVSCFWTRLYWAEIPMSRGRLFSPDADPLIPLTHFDRKQTIRYFRDGTLARSEGINLIELNALATGAVRHPLMEIPARMTNPNRLNCEWETVLTIAEVSAFFRLFRHTSSPGRSAVLRASRTHWMLPICAGRVKGSRASQRSRRSPLQPRNQTIKSCFYGSNSNAATSAS